MKKYTYLLYCLLFYAVCTAHGNATQQTQSMNEVEQNLQTALTLNPKSIQSFFKNTLNSSGYRHEVLPNDFSHLLRLVQYGQKKQLGRAYTVSILRLFNNALKGSMYINAYAFNQLVQDLTPLLHLQCTPTHVDPLEMMKKRINDTLYANFLNKFDQFKQDPDTFFDGISHDIATYAHDPSTAAGDISCQELRKMLMTFFEHSIGKLVWSPQGGIHSWHNVKDLAKSLECLLEQKVLTDEDDLNDLFVSLVERYALFLDINAPLISVDCYQEIKKEVLAQNLYFLELEEQEPFLEKKSHRMMHALLESEAKARATEYGIVVT